MQNKENLLSKEKATKQNRIWIRIASACNNRCIFCLDSYAHNGTFEDEIVVKKKIKDSFKEWFENRVIISGWEASIDPKFSEYIKYAKEIWYDRVQTVTNGNMFAKENFCKRVFETWLEEVTFSFHGHNSKLHDYLVSTAWAFKKSLKGLIYIKKYYPKVILNVDIVANKVNVKYLPDIVKFFMKLGIYEFDILQIIPFGRGFNENKDKLFYDISDYISELKETWELSKIPWMYMWTNRFPAEAFEWFEDLIQDPRKIKSEVMWENRSIFEKFIGSKWEKKPSCFWKGCEYCFQKQYCLDFMENQESSFSDSNLTPTPSPVGERNWAGKEYYILKGQEFPSDVYNKYGENEEEFKKNIKWKNCINLPKCLWWSWIYQEYKDLDPEYTLEDYTKKYIKYLYRKKSLRCKDCKYNNECKWIHINFIRSYGFNILEPISWE